MSSSTTSPARGLAKILGVKLHGLDKDITGIITPQEPVLSKQTNDSFVEDSPTASQWLREQIPTQQEAAAYAKSLFPFLSWIGHYNLQWFSGDVVAGITIGAVVVPQGMAYALLARLEPQFGLYSSFMGVIIYWIFGTSKDISIGPVAVLSTVVGTVVDDVMSSPDAKDVPAHVIASALSIIAGCIVLTIGLLRCGWIVDLIPITSLSAFMTGSAITIVASQLPSLMGLTGFSERDPAYMVVINTLQHLPEARIDAAIGLTALFLLYLIRYSLTSAAERYPAHKRIIFFMNTMRTVFVILLYTMISWLVNMHRRQDPLFRVLGAVPKGFRDVIAPQLPGRVVAHFPSHLPATVIVMLVEHIAISKSFGRVNNYMIDPSQEMVAIGMTNILGPFLGAYPSTGSFSRTAIQSKAGVRTPAAGLVTGIVVLLATYLLTVVFFYIPSATLAAVIVHAVGDLVTHPDAVYQFWRVSPIEVFVFFVGVFMSVFAHIEDGLYATVSISAAILLYRTLKARGRFLGRVRVHSVLGDHIVGEDSNQPLGQYGTFNESGGSAARDIYLPLDHGDGSNPEVDLESPYPGVFIYRFSGGLSYPNANSSLDYLANFIVSQTKRSGSETFLHAGDRPWSDPGPPKSAKSRANPEADGLPVLKAIILDFSSVDNVDITSVQRLIDVRNQLDLYAAPDVVDWHIACINNRWTKRALIAGGFGVPTKTSDGFHHRWKSIFSVAEIGGKDSAAAVADKNANERESQGGQSRRRLNRLDEEMGQASDSNDALRRPDGGDEKLEEAALSTQRRRGALLHSYNRPLFHVDLTIAVQSAISNVEAREEFKATGSGQSS
ncbi:hypothetical protein E4U42_001979 [Claviceps africana]|uniref:STAS domain-containing protein n=1 Tax=Claviceps africana TaxID=83212 RepID=A0A8K0J9D3_9HYPO|nr:hypothetical protein E4U42_001979 [Claviceps africana]